MNCKEARNWMSPYLDSELGQTKTFEVSEHLRRCPKCTKRFDSEREVDDTMRSRLVQQSMPDELWSGFQRELTVPSWVRRLSSWQGLAIAASLVIAVLSSIVLLRPVDERQSIPTIANRFIIEAPDNHPFAVVKPGRNVIDEVLRLDYGLRFASKSDVVARGHRDFQLISVTRRIDEAGRGYVEVRLNCCGKPVLVTMARPTHGELPTPFTNIQMVQAEQSLLNEQGVKLEHTTMGGVHVVVASRHDIKHIIDGISLVEI